MTSIKEQQQSSSENPVLIQQRNRAMDLAVAYAMETISLDEQSEALQKRAKDTELWLEETRVKTIREIINLRAEATDIQAVAERQRLMTEISVRALERMQHEDRLIQKLGQLSFHLVEQINPENESQIKSFQTAINNVNIGFFLHPRSQSNIINSRDNKSRFAIGPGGMIELVVFDESDFDTEIGVDYMFAGGDLYTFQRRMFHKRIVPGHYEPHYSQGAVIEDKSVLVDLSRIQPTALPNLLATQYASMNLALEQMVMETMSK